MNEAAMLEHLRKSIPDLEKSPNKTDGYDCKSEATGRYMELKSRNTHYDELMMEEKKYNYLISEASKLGMKPQYICWTPSGMYLFDLSTSHNSYTWVDKWLPKSTHFGSKEKITKSVTFLHIKNARKI